MRNIFTYDELKKVQVEREKDAERVIGQVCDVEREAEGSSMASINVDLRGEIEVKRLFLTVVVAAMIFCM